MSVPGGDTRLLLRQVRHELTTLWRSPIVLILSVGFPLVFFVLVASLVGNEVVDERGGVRLTQFLAPGFASFGVVMATFSFLAVGFAEARASGALKRQNGTPLPRWALLGGRIGAALLLGLAATALVLGVGIVGYDLQVPLRTLPSVLVTLVVSAMAFSALGLAAAALLPTPQTTTAVTNGVVIPLAFFSDIFAFGGTMPQWMSTLGWVFPLKHLVALFSDALNPYLTGSGFQLDHLAVILAWGLAGVLAAAWALRRERGGRTAKEPTGRRRAPAADATPRRDGAPSAPVLVLEQVRHTVSSLSRDASGVFFAVVFPLVLAAIIPTISGGGDVVMNDGALLGAVVAMTMAIYGTSVTAYVNMPEGLAEAREGGVLKRMHGTPLPLWAMLGGRIAGALGVGLLTLLALVVSARLMFGVPVPPAWPAVLLTFVLATLCFAVLGLAVMTLVRTAQSVVGVTLGTLLPLAFISDVFVLGVTYPPVVDAISWVFPLRHATRAITEAAAHDALWAAPSWGHLGVIALWTVLGAVVLVRRFVWTPREAERRQSSPVPATTVPASG